jgi:hypothetical protein
MKRIIFFVLVGAALYAGGVDFEALLGLDPAVVDAALMAVGVFFAAAFIVHTVWTISYVRSGQYAIDQRVDRLVRR